MGMIKYPPKVKLMAALLVTTTDLLTRVRETLQTLRGPIDLESDIYPFTFTDYYTDEMGETLSKQIISFEKLVDKDHLAATKRWTNQIEEEFAQRVGTRYHRRVNIDPGYVSDSKLVLASTKNFSHRIYLGQGIFAEVTMRYVRKRGFEPLEWTYPDYRTDLVRVFLESVRQRYMEQLRSMEWRS